MAEPLEPLVRCAECRRALRDHESTDGWREEFDDIGELYAFCPECWIESSAAAPGSWTRLHDLTGVA